MVGTNPFVPVGSYLRHQALRIVLRIEPQNLVNIQAVTVSDKTVLRRSEQPAAEFKDAASRPGSPEPPHHGIGRMRRPPVSQRAARPKDKQIAVQSKDAAFNIHQEPPSGLVLKQ